MNAMHIFLRLLICLFGILVLAIGIAHAGGLNVRGGLTRQMTLQPGGVQEGRIDVQNTGDVPLEVKVNLFDYRRTADGKSFYDDPGTHPRSMAKWIAITPRQMTVPAKTTLPVYFTVTVPKDDALIGTYWCMLMVEPVQVAPPSALPPAKPGEVRATVNTVVRYGVQMFVNIGDTGTRAMTFLDRRIVADDKSRILRIDIENTGQRVLAPSAWIELVGDDGKSLGRFTGNKARIYPGNSSRCLIDLTKVPVGQYAAMLVADNGDDYVFGTQFTLEIDALPPPIADTAPAQTKPAETK